MENLILADSGSSRGLEKHITLTRDGVIYKLSWDDKYVSNPEIVMVDELFLRIDFDSAPATISKCMCFVQGGYERENLKCKYWDKIEKIEETENSVTYQFPL
jgi:hypothetical protein